jgi:ubiquinone biosynthesis protein UbiJ
MMAQRPNESHDPPSQLNASIHRPDRLAQALEQGDLRLQGVDIKLRGFGALLQAFKRRSENGFFPRLGVLESFWVVHAALVTLSAALRSRRREAV